MKRFVYTIILIVFSIQSVLAVPMNHIMACHDNLPPERAHLTPVRSLARLHSPSLESERLFGMYGPKSAVPENFPYKQYDQAERPKDNPLNAMAALRQHLFPSPAADLAVSGRPSFLFRHLGMAGLANLVIKLDELKKSKNGLDDLKTFLMDAAGIKSKGKSTAKELRQAINLYTPMIIAALNELPNDPFRFCDYDLHDLFGSYAAALSERFQGDYDFGNYLETLCPGSKAKAESYTPLTKEGYFEWKTQLLPEAVVSPEQVERLKTDPLWAYQISEAIRAYEAIPISIPYGTALVDKVEFSNCCESGILSLILFFLYDPEKNQLDLTRIPESASQAFKDFFTEYNPRQPWKFHSKWSSVVANLKDQRISYNKVNDKTRCEVESGIPNVLLVMAEILGDSKLEDRSLPLKDRVLHLESLFSKGTSRYGLANDKDFEGANPPAEIEFESKDNSTTFSFVSHPGHTATTYTNSKSPLTPAFDRKTLDQWAGTYTPLYTNLIPIFLSPKLPEFLEMVAERDKNYVEQRKEVLKKIPPVSAYHLIMCNTLLPTDAKGDYISMVLTLNLFEVNSRLPGLNHRIALCDTYTNMSLLSAMAKHGQEESEKQFPDLWKRIVRAMHERPFDHIDQLIWIAERSDSCWDIVFSPSFTEKIIEASSNPKSLNNMASVICAFANCRGYGYCLPERLRPMLDLFKPYWSNLIKLPYVEVRHPDIQKGVGTLASPLMLASGATGDLLIPLFDLIDDKELEDAAFFFLETSESAPAPDGSVTITGITALERSFSKTSHGPLDDYLLNRLFLQCPDRIRNLKTTNGTLLHATLHGRWDNMNEAFEKRLAFLISLDKKGVDWLFEGDAEIYRSLLPSFKSGESYLDKTLSLLEEQFVQLRSPQLISNFLDESLFYGRISAFDKLMIAARSNLSAPLPDPQASLLERNGNWVDALTLPRALELIDLWKQPNPKEVNSLRVINRLEDWLQMLTDKEQYMPVLSEWVLRNSSVADNPTRVRSEPLVKAVASHMATMIAEGTFPENWGNGLPLVVKYANDWTYSVMKIPSSESVRKVTAVLDRISGIDGSAAIGKNCLDTIHRALEGPQNNREALLTFQRWYCDSTNAAVYRGSPDGKNYFDYQLIKLVFDKKETVDDLHLPFVVHALKSSWQHIKGYQNNILDEIVRICLLPTIESLLLSENDEIRKKVGLKFLKSGRAVSAVTDHPDLVRPLLAALAEIAMADTYRDEFDKTEIVDFLKCVGENQQDLLEDETVGLPVLIKSDTIDKRLESIIPFSKIKNKKYWVDRLKESNSGQLSKKTMSKALFLWVKDYDPSLAVQNAPHYLKQFRLPLTPEEEQRFLCDKTMIDFKGKTMELRFALTANLGWIQSEELVNPLILKNCNEMGDLRTQLDCSNLQSVLNTMIREEKGVELYENYPNIRRELLAAFHKCTLGEMALHRSGEYHRVFPENLKAIEANLLEVLKKLANDDQDLLEDTTVGLTKFWSSDTVAKALPDIIPYSRIKDMDKLFSSSAQLGTVHKARWMFSSDPQAAFELCPEGIVRTLTPEQTLALLTDETPIMFTFGRAKMPLRICLTRLLMCQRMNFVFHLSNILPESIPLLRKNYADDDHRDRYFIDDSDEKEKALFLGEGGDSIKE